MHIRNSSPNKEAKSLTCLRDPGDMNMWVMEKLELTLG